jgi:hypothetical protein
MKSIDDSPSLVPLTALGMFICGLLVGFSFTGKPATPTPAPQAAPTPQLELVDPPAQPN